MNVPPTTLITNKTFTKAHEYDTASSMKKRIFTEIAVSDAEKQAVLSKSHLCSGMSKTEVLQIAPLFQPYQLDRGIDIYEEGDQEAFLCLLVSGTVNVIKDYGMPSEKVLTTLEPGVTVGEISVIDSQPRSASVVANSETILYTLTQRNLDKMYSTSLKLWAIFIFNITLSLCARLRYTNDMVTGGGTSESLPAGLPANLSDQKPFLKMTES